MQLGRPQALRGRGRWAALSLGAGHSAGVSGDGELYTWGRHSRGQLGTGETAGSTRVPCPVRLLPGMQIRCGGGSSAYAGWPCS